MVACAPCPTTAPSSAYFCYQAPSDLALGTHLFAVSATACGTGGTSTVTRAFSIIAPVVVIDSHPSVVASSPVATFVFHTVDAVDVTCRLDGGVASPCSSPFTATTAGGMHTFTVTGTDLHGVTMRHFTWLLEGVRPRERSRSITRTTPRVNRSS